MTREGRHLPERGDSAELTIDLTSELVARFTDFCGDTNPLHHDDAFAKELGFPRRVVHGMCYASFLSTLIGTKLPGAGSLWASQSYRFIAPAFIGDRITLRASVDLASVAGRSVNLRIEALNQKGERLMEGESVVLLPQAEIAAPAASPRPVTADGDRPVALIAGASGALGAAISGALAQAGYAVALAGRNPDRLERLCAELTSMGASAQAVALDLTDSDSVETALGEIGGGLGPVGLAVHCASASLPQCSSVETGWESFQSHFEVQVGGLHRLLRACAPVMRAAKTGQFIYLASTAIHGPPPKGLSAYTSAKAGGSALAKSMAIELAPHGIRTNIVSPHFVATPLTHKTTDKSRKLIAAMTPLRRLASEQDVAQSVAFLASEQASFINGHDLVLDGGAVMA